MTKLYLDSEWREKLYRLAGTNSLTQEGLSQIVGKKFWKMWMREPKQLPDEARAGEPQGEEGWAHGRVRRTG